MKTPNIWIFFLAPLEYGGTSANVRTFLKDYFDLTYDWGETTDRQNAHQWVRMELYIGSEVRSQRVLNALGKAVEQYTGVTVLRVEHDTGEEE